MTSITSRKFQWGVFVIYLRPFSVYLVSSKKRGSKGSSVETFNNNCSSFLSTTFLQKTDSCKVSYQPPFSVFFCFLFNVALLRHRSLAIHYIISHSLSSFYDKFFFFKPFEIFQGPRNYPPAFVILNRKRLIYGITHVS